MSVFFLALWAFCPGESSPGTFCLEALQPGPLHCISWIYFPRWTRWSETCTVKNS